MLPFRSCLGSVLQKPPTCRCFGDPATSEPEGDGPEECPLSGALSLAGGDDTSQCFQEILKIPALHKTRRAEDPREEEMGSFLSARAEQRRESSLVLAGCSLGGGNLWMFPSPTASKPSLGREGLWPPGLEQAGKDSGLD